MSEKFDKTKNRLSKKVSKKSSKRKKNSNHSGLIMSLLLLFTLVASTFGFIISFNNDSTGSSDYNYNGFKFTNNNNIWNVKVAGKTLEFYNHPTQLEYITIPENIVNNLMNGNPIVVTFDPKISQGIDAPYIDQLRFDMTNALNAISAVTQKDNGVYSQLNVITCQNKSISYVENNESSTLDLNIIYLNKSNNNRIIEDENGCIIFESSSSIGFLELKDRLVYTLFGIMN